MRQMFIFRLQKYSIRSLFWDHQDKHSLPWDLDNVRPIQSHCITLFTER